MCLILFLLARYFECKAQHGLFAPAYRVSLQTPTVPATPQQSKLTLPAKSGALAQSKPRSGSQESVSSVGSSASTASRSRVRLGITSINKQVIYSCSIHMSHFVHISIRALKILFQIDCKFWLVLINNRVLAITIFLSLHQNWPVELNKITDINKHFKLQRKFNCFRY